MQEITIIDNNRDRLKYPLELHKPIFTINKHYKNLQKDKFGYYLDISRENLIIKVRIQPNIILNEFDHLIFLALLFIAHTEKKRDYGEQTQENHEKRITATTSFYKIAKLLKLPDNGTTYHRIRETIIKFNLTLITIEDDNKKYKFSAFPLIKTEVDEWGNFIANFEYNQLISKSILEIFMPRYKIIHLNDIVTNKINSILMAFYRTLDFNYKEITITSIIQEVYTLDDDSYNALKPKQLDKYLNKIIKDTKEIIKILKNIKLVIKKPKKESYIIVTKNKNEIINI